MYPDASKNRPLARHLRQDFIFFCQKISRECVLFLVHPCARNIEHARWVLIILSLSKISESSINTSFWCDHLFDCCSATGRLFLGLVLVCCFCQLAAPLQVTAEPTRSCQSSCCHIVHIFKWMLCKSQELDVNKTRRQSAKGIDPSYSTVQKSHPSFIFCKEMWE